MASEVNAVYSATEEYDMPNWNITGQSIAKYRGSMTEGDYSEITNTTLAQTDCKGHDSNGKSSANPNGLYIDRQQTIGANPDYLELSAENILQNNEMNTNISIRGNGPYYSLEKPTIQTKSNGDDEKLKNSYEYIDFSESTEGIGTTYNDIIVKESHKLEQLGKGETLTEYCNLPGDQNRNVGTCTDLLTVNKLVSTQNDPQDLVMVENELYNFNSK